MLMGRNWKMLILPELTYESVWEGMEKGLDSFIYAPQDHIGTEPPVIHSVQTDNRIGIIEIKASEYNAVQ